MEPLPLPTRLQACDALAALLPMEPFSQRLTEFIHRTLRMVTRVQTHARTSTLCWPRNSWERKFIHQAADLVGVDHVTLRDNTKFLVRYSKESWENFCLAVKYLSFRQEKRAYKEMRETRSYKDIPALKLSHNPVRSFGLALAHFPDTWCTDLVRVVCSLSLDHPRFTKIIEATHKDQVASDHMLTRESFLALLLNP
jgi:hypothetical protein